MINIISKKATIAATAEICHPAAIHDYSVIGENCHVGRGTEIGEYCHVGDGVIIGENCHIGEGVIIGSGAVIEYGAIIDGGAEIPNNAIIGSGLFVMPSTHPMWFPYEDE